MKQHGHADAHRAALHGGHQRGPGPRQGGQQGVAFAAQRIAGAGSFSDEVVQVVAGGEGVALGLDQDAADVRIICGSVDRRAQRPVHVAGEGVLLFRAVEGEGEHAPSHLDQDVVGHPTVTTTLPIC